ncbi:MAG TPA: hypothetical protein VH105_19000 [Burkholderiales bacterium]|jgi:hypothetical protein|nr:hypothetical protein [Burkholderiales bacterium]
MPFEQNSADRPLIRGLEDVNSAVRVVHAAWNHFSQWQEIGGRCAMTARQLLIARELLIEAIEGWALAISRLLGLARERDGFEALSESLEGSLCRAGVYLRAMSAVAGPGGTDFSVAGQRAYRE